MHGVAPDLFLGNVPFHASDADLLLFLDGLVPTRCVGIPKDGAGYGRGCAFVTLGERVDVEAARIRLDGIVFQGRALRVTRVRPTPR